MLRPQSRLLFNTACHGGRNNEGKRRGGIVKSGIQDVLIAKLIAEGFVGGYVIKSA